MADSPKPNNPAFGKQDAPRIPRLRIGSRLLLDAFAVDSKLLLKSGEAIRAVDELAKLTEPNVYYGPNRSKHVPIDLSNELRLDAQQAQRKTQTNDEEVIRETRVEEFKERVQRAARLKSEAISNVKAIFTSIESSGRVDVPLARNAASALLAGLLEGPSVLVSMVRLKDADAYTYTHCVHVSILAMYLAMHTEYEKDIEELGVGALLHDVGKAGIPMSILHKTGPLSASEMKTIMHHPSLGAGLLARAGTPTPIVLSCVLDHHEKVTGTGYPNRKMGSAISAHAKITSLADIYDALTTHRPYRRAMEPVEALAVMTHQMGNDFDPLFLQRFVSAIGFFTTEEGAPQNSRVSAKAMSIPKDMLRPAEEVTRIFDGLDTLC